MTTSVLTADRVVLPDRTVGPAWVVVGSGRIVDVGTGEPPVPAAMDLGDVTLAPGFVDQHVHGGGGASFADGPAAVARAVTFHRTHGTTTLVASLVSEASDVLRTQVEALADSVEAGLLDGIHLEGPWLAESRCGAHDPAVLRDPEPAEVESLLAAGRGAVRMVTLAPERRGALAAVRLLRQAGVVVAVGHTDADYDTVRAAQAAGADVATHLFNAMPDVHHRRPGPVPALLTDPGTVVELVCDGVHLHDGVALLAIDAAGPDRVALITDATAAAGAGDGEIRLGSLAVRVVDGTARLADGGALAGSTLTMDAALRRVVAAGVPLADAVLMAATVPARVLGRPDRGRIAPGCRADLVVLDADLRVRRVMRAGAWV